MVSLLLNGRAAHLVLRSGTSNGTGGNKGPRTMPDAKLVESPLLSPFSPVQVPFC
jgi:hypothetical protein